MSGKLKSIVLFFQIIATIIAHFFCMKWDCWILWGTIAKRWSVGRECNSNKQIHESTQYLSYFPWEDQSNHANLCSDHWLAPCHSWSCDLPHKYHHHPLQKHQHQMPKCGYNRGNFLLQCILSLKGNYILLLQYITARPQRKNIQLSHFLPHPLNSWWNVEWPVLQSSGWREHLTTNFRFFLLISKLLMPI